MGHEHGLRAARGLRNTTDQVLKASHHAADAPWWLAVQLKLLRVSHSLCWGVDCSVGLSVSDSWRNAQQETPSADASSWAIGCQYAPWSFLRL